MHAAHAGAVTHAVAVVHFFLVVDCKGIETARLRNTLGKGPVKKPVIEGKGQPCPNKLSALISAALLLNLVACGGGGGGGNVRADPPPASPPPAPPPPVVSSPIAEYSKHLALTNATWAHAAGWTGQGVRIGVVDSGVNRNHPALYPRVKSNLVYLGPGNNLSVDDVVGHGTAVSQIMAGAPFGAWPGGMAPGAEIISARIISDKPPSDDGSGHGNEVHGALGLKSIHQDLIDRGARVMNNSWGGLYWTDLNATAPIADEYRPFIISNGGLVVFATGNESRPTPSDMASLPSKPGPNGTMPAADLEVGWLAAAALDTANPTQLASYSNACGVAMRYCLVAPGDVVTTGTNDAPNNPSYWNWRGTSFAAPQVSGAAALVWQAFPYFNNDLVRQTLLGTATDLGTPGPDATFGYGLLNVAAAVRGPARLDWGNTVVTLESGTSTWSNPISGSGGLTKQGGGKLILTQGNTYVGRTQVMGGELQVDSEITSPVTIGPAGTLSGYARVGAVDNAGMLRVDNVMRVVGDYQQNSAGKLGLMLGGWLYVEGTATLDGTVHVLGARPGYVASSYTPFLSANRLVGQFSGLTAAPGVFLDATINYGTTDVWLNVKRVDVSVAAKSMGLSPMSVSSGERIEHAFDEIDARGETGGTSGVGGDFLAAAGEIQRSPSAIAAERTLSSLSGELHGADTALALMTIEGNRHALEARLDALQGVVAGGWGHTLQMQRMLATLKIDGSGWILGQDAQAGHWRYGAAFGRSDGYAWHGLRGDRERNRQIEGQLYLQWMRDQSYVSGRLAEGRMDQSMRRDVLLGADAFEVATDYANRYSVLGVQAGHHFQVGDGQWTPYAGTQALRVDRAGFAEKGAAGFGLSAGESSFTATQALLGARLDQQWQWGRTRVGLNGRMEWQHTLSQRGMDIEARFTGIDVWSPILGEGLAANTGVLGFGLDAQFARWGQWSVDADARRERGNTFGQAWLRWSRPLD